LLWNSLINEMGRNGRTGDGRTCTETALLADAAESTPESRVAESAERPGNRIYDTGKVET
jgi:hypothetical protein